MRARQSPYRLDCSPDFIVRTPYPARLYGQTGVCGQSHAHHPESKGDLATAFVDRCYAFTKHNGSYSVVTPQNWLFLGAYKKLREQLLRECEWNFVAKLGPAAFEDMNWWAANTALLMFTNSRPSISHQIVGVDVSAPRVPVEKAVLLQSVSVQIACQKRQLGNPDARISLEETLEGTLLGQYASSLQGTVTGDSVRYVRCFWEAPTITNEWRELQSTVQSCTPYGGREHMVFWRNGGQELASNPQARVQGMSAWNKQGIVISQMRELPATLYSGDVSITMHLPLSPINPLILKLFGLSANLQSSIKLCAV